MHSWLIGFWMWALTLLAYGGSLTGRVVAVVDGDTLQIRPAGQAPLRVRLAGIDAPEQDQPWGIRSRDHLARLVLYRTATVAVQKTDDYGRIVGRVTVGGVDVETEQVRQGFAWVYSQYNRDPELLKIEAEARQARRGLWSDAHPIPPWDWRHNTSFPKPTVPSPQFHNGRCGEKFTCREMTSCAEAQFFLTKCGIQQLDRDQDGMPCEALCRMNHNSF